MSRNLAASVRARLKQHADATEQTQWKAFLNKNRLDPMLLADVVKSLRSKFQGIGVI